MNTQTAALSAAVAPENMTVEQMLAERAAWEARINAAIATQRAGVIAEIKGKIAAFGLTAADLGLSASATVQTLAAVRSANSGGSRKDRPAPGTGKVAPKYGDAAGNLWTGRGKKPGWVVAIEAAGGNINDYRLTAEQQAAHTPAPAPVTVEATSAPSPEPTQAPADTADLVAQAQATLDAATGAQEPANTAAPESAPEAAAEVAQAPAANLTPPPNAKYWNAATGEYWHGKFKRPEWVDAWLTANPGKTLADLEVKQSA